MVDEDLITFAKCAKKDELLIKNWWNSSHVIEFWDTSPEMWSDFMNYIGGHKGLFDYWIGYYDQKPFCLIMTSVLEPVNDPNDPYPIDHIIPWLEPKGINLGFDFMIGEASHLGKGLSYRALRKFMQTEGSSVAAFFIDPASSNAKAIHIYRKAGFEVIANFISKTGSNKGLEHFLMKYQNCNSIA